MGKKELADALAAMRRLSTALDERAEDVSGRQAAAAS
jgi:hypothetical protein